MTEENLQNESNSRRFLLGEMPEDERLAFEEEFIADENLFEQTRVVEDELIESYIRGTISSSERKKFESHFLSTDSRRRRVEFTRTMLDRLAGQKEIAAAAKKTETAEENSSVFGSIASFFRTPKLVFGAAFALLILIFGGWFLLKTSTVRNPEIAKQITPTPTIQPSQNQNAPVNQVYPATSNINAAEKNPANRNALPGANKVIPDKNQNSNAPISNSVGAAPILALFTGAMRSEGKMAELNLPKNASGANLQLNLDSQDYKIYQVEIVDPDGNLVVQNEKLRAKNSKINLFVPAAKLQRGEYIIKVSALNPNKENESIADYSFRVNRK